MADERGGSTIPAEVAKIYATALGKNNPTVDNAKLFDPYSSRNRFQPSVHPSELSGRTGQAISETQSKQLDFASVIRFLEIHEKNAEGVPDLVRKLVALLDEISKQGISLEDLSPPLRQEIQDALSLHMEAPSSIRLGLHRIKETLRDLKKEIEGESDRILDDRKHEPSDSDQSSPSME